MQSPGLGPQDPDAETQRVHGTPAGFHPDPADPGGAAPYDDAERTRLAGEDSGSQRPGQADGWPTVVQPPAGPGFPPVAAGRPRNDPYGQTEPHAPASPYGQTAPYGPADPRGHRDPYGRDDPQGGPDPYGRGGPQQGEDEYGEEAQTRILPDGAGSGWPPGTSAGQGRSPAPEEYPPTAAYPPAGGYGAASGAGGPSGPASGGYGGSPGYPPTGYPPPGGYAQPAAGYDQGYQQQGYQQGYPGPGYQEQGYQQGYQQQGYPAAGGYQQGYPPAGAYGAYPPAGTGPAGGPRPGGSGRRRAVIIGAAVVVVLLLIIIPVVLLTGGSDDGKPAAADSVSPSAPPTAPASPSATLSSSPSPSPSASPSASSTLTPAENELVAKLDSSAMTDCKPNRDAESDHILAALFCDSDDGKVVAAYAYATAGDLTSDVDVRKSLATAPGGTCKTGGSEVFTWNFDQGKTQGTAVCTVRDSSHFIFWSYDDKLVSFMATGTDGVALYEWWSGFDPVPQS
ncbi:MULTISPECIES: hypothetical protein [Frankia]|uniref:Uncharacterized protein n=1 Tax=Frankia alni (strain DSM 45986 / CECT 9034 / ACN14a) TaxID=326424 RepID=Q0RRE0_FRAAA|nr:MULTISPECIES: hypothetical protein [Frankia]CAJ59879.1 hypothetical protein FRAAL1218 [Frankia alni ACN14a]